MIKWWLKASLTLSILGLMSSCSPKQESPNLNSQSQKVDTLIMEHVKSNKNLMKPKVTNSDRIIYELDLKQAPLYIIENLENENQKIELKLKNANHKKIVAKLTTKPPLNLRFNNVLLNDESIDGPFGQELEYNFDQEGNYSLIIGKSPMASGTHIGKVEIEIKVY